MSTNCYFGHIFVLSKQLLVLVFNEEKKQETPKSPKSKYWQAKSGAPMPVILQKSIEFLIPYSFEHHGWLSTGNNFEGGQKTISRCF